MPSVARSPLGLVVLALLREQPMHAYRMQKLIEQRAKDQVVNVRSRNSIQQTIVRLERDGLIRATGAERQGAFPQRTVYALTAQGQTELLQSLHHALASPAREFPLFPAALSFIAVTSMATAREMLALRRTALMRARDELDASLRAVEHKLPAILLIEDEYRRAMRQAEIAWIDRTLTRIDAGELTWDTESLIEKAPDYEP